MRTRRRAWWFIVLGAGVVFLALTARLFIWPETNTPRRAGAIVVLGSDTVNERRRVEEGEKLLRAGDAPVLAISDAGRRCPVNVTDTVTCFSPSPSTTQGEARFIRQMARLRHWNSVIVVSGRPQATRARLRIERCFAGTLEIVGVDPPSVEQWVYEIAYEWAATTKALTIQRGC